MALAGDEAVAATGGIAEDDLELRRLPSRVQLLRGQVGEGLEDDLVLDVMWRRLRGRCRQDAFGR
jgi:hypothetical protein